MSELYNNARKILYDIIEDFSPDKFIRFFREKNRSFAQRREDLFQYDDDNFRNGVKLGEIQFAQDEKMLICAFEASQPLAERSGKKAQYEKGKKILKDSQSDAGIFVFYDPQGNFRFSLIYANYLGTRRDWSAFRRFTYFVSPSETNKTFLQRVGECTFSSLEKIKDAFSVEKVTKEFYTEIANWYFWAVKNTEFPKDAEKEEHGRNIAVIRMITRLIFIWFMKERGLVQQNLFNYKNISTLLKDLSPENTTYYKAILHNLFFATLNTKIEARKFRFGKSYHGRNKDYMDHGIYRYEDCFKNKEDMLEIFKDIPFLNGGLFDCLDRRIPENDKNIEIRIDGFTDKEVGLSVPNALFFSDEINVDLNKDYGTTNKKYKFRGLIDILSSYNFTIDENDPNDADVALDPELLGKVFENLLASFNPETASTARKATGSYYTPREIVDYMVTQSLKEYFKTYLNYIIDIDNKLDLLFTHDSETNPFSKSDTLRMVTLIDSLRIVDPAVGSGAFPMGILNKLVFILSKLDPENTLWKETQIKAVDESVTDPILKQKLKEQIEEQFAEKNFDYGRKLYLIQKCIYGVDIQQIAVEIAKLRFFISLLVDEKIDKSKPNWGIEPLPNLDFKLMQGNSLISEFMGINLDADGDSKQGTFLINEEDKLINQFQSRKNEYQNEPDRDKKEKLKNEINDLIVKIFETKLKRQKADYFKQLRKIEENCAALPNEKQRQERVAKEKEALYKKSGFNLEATEKQLCEFTSGLKVKPFFAWKLYFAEVFQEKDGFDVVIANPPYVRQEDIKEYKPLLKKAGYKVYNSTSDLYTYFYELSYNILASNRFSCFISSNKWMRAKYGEKLRNFFKTKTEVMNLIDLGGHKVFDATVDTNILLFQKCEPQNDYQLPYTNIDPDFAGTDLDGYVTAKQQILKQTELSNFGWTLADVKVLALKRKIEKTGTPLKNWDVKIYRGVITGFNEAFIIDNETKERLCKEDPKSGEILKPILRGRDIERYSYKWAGLWLIKIESGWTNKNRGTKNPEMFFKETYPAIYRHLKSMGKKQGKGKGLYQRDDQGNYWWELRDCDYYGEFEKEKIVYPDITERLSFVCEHGTNFVNNTVYFINSGNKYLFAILNSLLMDFYYRQISSQLSTKAIRSFTIYIEQLPIPKIPESEQKSFVDLVNRILAVTKDEDYLQNKQKQAMVKAMEREIDQMVYNLYGLTPEEIEIVEGEG